MSDITNTYDLLAQSGQTKSLVILLHGLGSNGQDLISLAPYFAGALKDTTFISPDAPFACDMVPPGYPNSFQWFSLQNRDPDIMLKGVQGAAPVLESYITEQIEKYGVSPEKCALVGFSQGTMMSLYTGPRYKDSLAGIVGYSGALLWEPDVNIAALNTIPVHLVHGEADDVVPVDAYHMAKKKLEDSGFSLSGHTTKNLTHSIDENGIKSAVSFLSNILNQ